MNSSKSDNNFFFVLNSDIICEFPLEHLIEFHKSHGKEVSLLVKEVEDPSKYGVVISNENGKVTQFIEKPTEFMGNKINAGIYIFNNSIIDKIELKPHFLEKDIFPKLAEEGNMYSCPLSGFWMDIGKPKNYLTAIKYYLNYLKENRSDELSKGDNIIGNVIIHPTA